MKRLLIISLVANIVLAWLYMHGRVQRPDTRREPSGASLHTIVDAPPAPFNWSQIESTDYFSFVANLRSIGCPEQTIRDIVAADVRALALTKPSVTTSEWLAQPENFVDYLVQHGTQDQIRLSGSPGLPRHLSVALVNRSFIPGGHVISDVAVDTRPDAAAEEPATPDATNTESRRQRLQRAREFWIADLVRARYGTDSLTSWQREAAKQQIPLESFLRTYSIDLTEFSFQQ